MLGNVIIDAYSSFGFWNLLWLYLTKLTEMKDRYETQDPLSSDLPEDCEHALAHFSYMLGQACKASLQTFKAGMPASPPLREHYAREPQDPNTTMIRVRGKGGRSKDHLLWLLEQLLGDEQVHIYGLHNLLDELERVTQDMPRKEIGSLLG